MKTKQVSVSDPRQTQLYIHIKHSELKKKDKAYGMKKRKEGIRNIQPQYYLIVCEGKKTEPNYFEGLKRLINERYNNRIDVRDNSNTLVSIDVKGEGTNTIYLLERAKKYVEENPNHYSHVWLVYDKDDFPKDDFDNTEFAADALSSESTQYHVAWSNQCIELWFLLHFIPMYSDVHREDYKEKLKEFIPYEKNLPNIFDILYPYVKQAIKRAEVLYGMYTEKIPSKMSPATRVHELVGDLLKYLE